MTGVLDSLVPSYLTGNSSTEQDIASGGAGLGSMFNALKDLPEAVGQGVGQLAGALNPVNLVGQAAGAVTGNDPVTGQHENALERVIGGAMAGGAVYGLGRAGLGAYQQIRTHYPDLFGPMDEYGAMYPRDVFRGKGQAFWPDGQMDPSSPLAKLGGQPAPGPEGALAAGFKFPYDEGLLGPYKNLTPDDFLNSRTGDLLRARSVDGVAQTMVMEHPTQVGLFHSLADQYGALPAHQGSHPVTALGWELNKWTSAAERGILPPEDLALWKKSQYGQASSMELNLLQQRMVQFASDTSFVNDPNLAVHPMLDFTKVVPQADGSNLLVLKHRNFSNDVDLTDKSVEASKIRQDRLTRLDYRALAPVVSDNVKRMISLATPEERQAATGWYQQVNRLFHDDPAQLHGEYSAMPEDSQPVPGMTKQQAVNVAQWRIEHPEIQGELLSAITAATSGQKPWGGPETALSNPELATKAISTLLSKAHGSLDEFRNMDWSRMMEPEYRGGVFNSQKLGGISTDEFAKSARLLGGDDFLDVMFGGDPKTNSLKTRNFSVNIADPTAWFPTTMDRHAYAIAVGMDPSIEKPPVGARRETYNSIADVYRSAALDEGLLPNEVQALTWTVWKRIKEEYNANIKTGRDVQLGDGSTLAPQPRNKLLVTDDRVLRLIQGEGDLAPHQVAASIPSGDQLVPSSTLKTKTIPGQNPKQLTIIANPNTGDKLVVAPSTDSNLRAMGPAYPTPYLDGRSFPDGQARPWSNIWERRFAAPVDDVQAHADRIHANQTAHAPEDISPQLGMAPGRYRRIQGLISSVDQPDGGATIHPVTSEQPTEGHAVVTKPKLGMKIPSGQKVSVDAVDQWLSSVSGELAKSGAHVGTWHNPETGDKFFDVSNVFPEDKRAAAIKAGKAANQIRIAHMGAIAKGDWDNAFTQTGGSGDVEGMFHPAPSSKPDPEILAKYLENVRRGTPATELRAQSADTLPSMQGKHSIVINGLVDLKDGMDPAIQGSAMAVHNQLLRTLKERGVQPTDSTVLNPHQADTPFGKTSRQSLVMNFDKAADLQHAWDVTSEFAPQYNEPVLDRRAYVFGSNEAPNGTSQVFEHHYQSPDGSTLSHLSTDGSSMDPHTVQTWAQNEFAGTFAGAKPAQNTIDRGDDGQTAIYNGAVRVVDRGPGTARTKLKTSGLLDTTRNGEKVKELSIWVPPTADIPVMSFSDPELLAKRNPAVTPDRVFHGTIVGGRVKLMVPTTSGPTGEVFNLSMFEQARQALQRAGATEVTPIT